MDFLKRVGHKNCNDNDKSGMQKSGAIWLKQLSECLKTSSDKAPSFQSKNEIIGELSTMRLRRFGAGRKTGGRAILLIAPLTVHDPSFVDLMRGHSLVSILGESKAPVFVTDWRSASSDMRLFSIDTYLADLNVALDDIGGDVDLVGLCQGGLLALILAARFPNKIRRLVLAGTPADVAAKSSPMTRIARKLRTDAQMLPEDDVVNGGQWLGLMGSAQAHERAAIDTMQRNPASFARIDLDAIAAYENWTRNDLDLPGRYTRELIANIFDRNELASGKFRALGQTIDLSRICAPIFVLCGARDEIVPKEQALAVLEKVGTPKTRMRMLVAPCGHFSLFVGLGTLSREWRTISGWLSSEAAAGRPRVQTA